MGKWQKRTRAEIEKSVSDGDYTGGYDFFPWILHMRKGMAFATLLNIFLGYKAYQGYFEYGREFSILIVAAVFGIAIPVFIVTSLVSEYKKKKKNKNS